VGKVKKTEKKSMASSPKLHLQKNIGKKALQLAKNYLQTSGTGYGRTGAGNHGSMRGWDDHSSNADNDLVVNRKKLAQRSHSLFMDSPLANGVLKDIAQNVTGGGLTLKCNINYEYLGISHEEARKLEKNIEFEFGVWANNPYSCDLEGSKSFDDLQVLAMLSVLLSGDVFVATPLRARKDSIYDLRIKLISAHRIDDPMYKDVTLNILNGIEVDGDGFPVAYYVWNHLPDDPQFAKIEAPQAVRIPAFGKLTGRRNLLHLFTAERPEQRRGIPILSPIIEMFKQLNVYSEAEITSAVVSSMFSVFITKKDPTEALFDVIKNNANLRMDDLSPQQEKYEEYAMKPGMAMTLQPGEKIETANPSRPNTAFDGFVMSVLKQIAVGLGLPPEFMLKNMNSSYSASRAAVLLAWEMFSTRRRWLVKTFCQPIYELWLSEAVAKSRVNMPGFFNDPMVRAAWCKTTWVGSRPIQLDPLKDAAAAKMRIDECLTTRDHEAAELGRSFDDNVPIREAEESQMDEVRRTEKILYRGSVDANESLKGKNGNNKSKNKSKSKQRS